MQESFLGSARLGLSRVICRREDGMVSPLVAKVTYVPPFGARGNHPVVAAARTYVCQTDAHTHIHTATAAKNRVDSRQYGRAAAVTYTYAKSRIGECAVADSGIYAAAYIH